MYTFLVEEILDDSNLWLRDTKSERNNSRGSCYGNDEVDVKINDERNLYTLFYAQTPQGSVDVLTYEFFVEETLDNRIWLTGTQQNERNNPRSGY